MPNKLFTKKWLLPLILFVLTTTGCRDGINANYQDAAIQTVQIIDAKGVAVGGKSQYLKLTLESNEDLAAFTKGLLQFRAHVVMPNGERFLTLGAGTIEEKPNQFVPYNYKNSGVGVKNNHLYSIFFFRDLSLDYDGNYKINLVKDSYDAIEFDVSYRIFSGPQLASSKTLSFSKKAFLKIVEARKINPEPPEPVSMMLEF